MIFVVRVYQKVELRYDVSFATKGNRSDIEQIAKQLFEKELAEIEFFKPNLVSCSLNREIDALNTLKLSFTTR